MLNNYWYIKTALKNIDESILIIERHCKENHKRCCGDTLIPCNCGVDLYTLRIFSLLVERFPKLAQNAVKLLDCTATLGDVLKLKSELVLEQTR